ncbi:MAG: FadR/GntR family transcriptional regulator [Xanthomonadales bacterium]|jgi:GntR family transcriptional repressor for pyruvate dehydrogenase complex|nr:FadR/GntR family transcriptional regulator [Xanthomonadales bacterium]
MELTAVNVKRLYLQIAEQLAAPIRSGELARGEKLPSERELASQLSVSRPTIREAITTLEVMGMVEVRPGSGVYVRDSGSSLMQLPENVPGPFEILEARKTLEPEVAAFAANRISDAQVKKLRQLLRDFGKPGLGPGEIEKIDREFHNQIAEATRNSALSGLVKWLWALRSDSKVSIKFYQRARDQGVRPAVEDHRAIIAALMARNENAARQAMREHLQRAIEDLTEMSLD